METSRVRDVNKRKPWDYRLCWKKILRRKEAKTIEWKTRVIPAQTGESLRHSIRHLEKRISFLYASLIYRVFSLVKFRRKNEVVRFLRKFVGAAGCRCEPPFCRITITATFPYLKLSRRKFIQKLFSLLDRTDDDRALSSSSSASSSRGMEALVRTFLRYHDYRE